MFIALCDFDFRGPLLFMGNNVFFIGALSRSWPCNQKEISQGNFLSLALRETSNESAGTRESQRTQKEIFGLTKERIEYGSNK